MIRNLFATFNEFLFINYHYSVSELLELFFSNILLSFRKYTKIQTFDISLKKAQVKGKLAYSVKRD